MIPKKFKINRKEWLRGKDGSESYLLRKDDGKKCCLGFYALAKGITKKHITNLQNPFELICKNGEPMMQELVCYKDYLGGFDDNQIASNLMGINDDSEINDSLREDRIKEQFAKLGVEVEFYN